MMVKKYLHAEPNFITVEAEQFNGLYDMLNKYQISSFVNDLNMDGQSHFMLPNGSHLKIGDWIVTDIESNHPETFGVSKGVFEDNYFSLEESAISATMKAAAANERNASILERARLILKLRDVSPEHMVYILKSLLLWEEDNEKD